jgi:hypothetical protein
MCVNLPEGECRVTILFACHSDSVLTNITLDEEAWVKPHTYSKKILFLGDSITQGWQSERDSMSYAWLLSRYLDADRLNWGVGGSVFHADTLEDVGFEPDMIFIAVL